MLYIFLDSSLCYRGSSVGSDHTGQLCYPVGTSVIFVPRSIFGGNTLQDLLFLEMLQFCHLAITIWPLSNLLRLLRVPIFGASNTSTCCLIYPTPRYSVLFTSPVSGINVVPKLFVSIYIFSRIFDCKLCNTTKSVTTLVAKLISVIISNVWLIYINSYCL